MFAFAEWLEHHQLPCTIKQSFGFDCPGCGSQRAFIALIKGDVFGSIDLYPALIPMLFLFIFLGLHLYFKFKKGALVLQYTFIFISLLIFSNFMVKLFANTP